MASAVIRTTEQNGHNYAERERGGRELGANIVQPKGGYEAGL